MEKSMEATIEFRVQGGNVGMEKKMETTIMIAMVIKDYCKDPILNH